MAYIGKDPAQIKRALNEKDTFTGDGSTVAFDLTSDAIGANEIQVFVDNIRQEPGASDAYTLGEDGSGNLRRITFTAAPDNGAEIYVLNPKTTDSNLIVPSDNSVTSAKIVDGTIVNADINACAAIADTKLATISTSGKVATSAISQPGSPGVYLDGTGSWSAIDTTQQDTNAFNIGLLGFKMAVNEGLTVFNLIDGVVDEFNDESGTDESEGSNDTYCGTSDFYINYTYTPACASAGFTTTSITEPDTSTAGTNPAVGSGTRGEFTVPSGMTSLNAYMWGAGGGGGGRPSDSPVLRGGGGGFTSGIMSVSPGQVLKVSVAEGGGVNPAPNTGGTSAEGGLGVAFGGGTSNDGGAGAGGGGASGLMTPSIGAPYSAPQLYMIAAGGGGSGYACNATNTAAGDGGGLGGGAGGVVSSEQTASSGGNGGGGDQEQGGQGATGPGGTAQTGGFLEGGDSAEPIADNSGGGGEGYYGGGGGANGSPGRTGGGGSSYFGNPSISCGATEEGCGAAGGGLTSPFYVAGTNEAGIGGQSATQAGEDGYVLITGSYCTSTPGGSTTLVSTAFSATSVPTNARIVVFEEDVDSPTLNTDVIASVSRDAGVTYTNATLSDSGYVTGSSGQRILTGQADISGQPSGQSMRWKLALANNTVKIHGVSLQWS